MRDDHDYLLDAIDRLTLPTRQRHVLTTGPEGIQCVTFSEHEPLLERLRDAISGSTGSHAGGSSDPTTRLPFDPVALALYDRIEKEVSEWFVELRQEPVYLLPEQTLRQWFVTFNAFRRKDDVGEWEVEVTRKVSSWVRRITDMFDVPKRMEVTTQVEVPVVDVVTGEQLVRADGSLRTRMSTKPAACPWCHQSTAFDPATGDLITALVVTYRQSQEHVAVDAAVGVCRSCEHEWKGGSGVRRLRAQLDNVENGLHPDADLITPEVGPEV